MSISHFSCSLRLRICFERNKQAKKVQAKPRKTTLSEETWELIQEKRQWRADLAQYQKLQNLARLRLAFSAWHVQQEGPLIVPQFDALLA